MCIVSALLFLHCLANIDIASLFVKMLMLCIFIINKKKEGKCQAFKPHLFHLEWIFHSVSCCTLFMVWMGKMGFHGWFNWIEIKKNTEKKITEWKKEGSRPLEAFFFNWSKIMWKVLSQKIVFNRIPLFTYCIWQAQYCELVGWYKIDFYCK